MLQCQNVSFHFLFIYYFRQRRQREDMFLHYVSMSISLAAFIVAAPVCWISLWTVVFLIFPVLECFYNCWKYVLKHKSHKMYVTIGRIYCEWLFPRNVNWILKQIRFNVNINNQQCSMFWWLIVHWNFTFNYSVRDCIRPEEW